MTPAGLPHSEICGSMLTCSSPQLIAAYRVLLRFETPRHPPYALKCLTYVLQLKVFSLYPNCLEKCFHIPRENPFCSFRYIAIADDLSEESILTLPFLDFRVSSV